MMDGPELLFSPMVWLIFAVALILLDMLAGMALFVLSFGIAAVIVAGLLFAQQQGLPLPLLLDDWQTVTLCFAVLSVACIGLVKRLVKGKSGGDKDINHY